jgi:PAS domain S-box-containing protein
MSVTRPTVASKLVVDNPPVYVWLILLAMLSFTGLTWHLVDKDSNHSAQSAFDRQVEKTRQSVEERMHAYANILRGGAGLFHASELVTRKDWQRYVSTLELAVNFPGLQGFGFSQHISPAELARHVRQIRDEGFKDYSVKPEGVRPEYTSIIFLEPNNQRNQRAFGFDMFSEPIRQAAMAQARDSKEIVLSGKVVLKQEIGKDVQTGFLMYLPLYDKNAVLNTVEERRSSLLGYVYAAFRVNDLMLGIMGPEESEALIDLEIYDGTEINKTSLMFDDDKIMHGDNAHKAHLYNSVAPLVVANHVWTLAITSTHKFEAEIDRTKAYTVALTGIVISFLFFIMAWSMSTQRSRALYLAQQMVGALKTQENLTQAILDEAADGIITINGAGEILSYNNAAAYIFGYTTEETLGKNIRMLMPEPYQSRHDGYLVNYLTTGQKKIIGIGREVRGLRKNGEEFAMDLAVSEVKQEGDQRIFAGIVRDISERKAAEEKLRLSEERFDLAIRGANDGLWDWDIVNNTSYHSPRWNAMFGLPEIETNDQTGSWLTQIHPDDVKRVKAEVADYLAGNIPHYRTEYRVKHQDGHYLWILSRGIAKLDAQGRPVRMAGIYSDISKQKQMDNMKSEFVSTVSHELRTPLTSIRGSLGLIAGGVTGELPAQAKPLIEVAYRNTDRLLTLINDILDIDKIQSGKIDFSFSPHLLMPLVEQVISANRGYAEQYHVSFNLLDPVPDVWVNVDDSRLMQVLSNLLSNAAKFSHAGGAVDISVSRESKGVRVAISDHGVGISADFYDRIFQKFTQGDSSDTRHKGGTGLGLSISKAIIELMHGEIGFNSVVGAGTTFYFILPEWREENIS